MTSTTRPLDPDTFPEPMRDAVRWHLLFTEADELTARSGLGLASFWHKAKTGNYAAARAVLDERMTADRCTPDGWRKSDRPAVMEEVAAVAARMGNSHAVRADFVAGVEAAHRGDRTATDACIRGMQNRCANALQAAAHPERDAADHLPPAAVYAEAALVLWRVYVHGREVTG